MNKTRYLREVLGVKNYLCSPSVQKIRSLEGEIPAKVLVISLETLNPEEKQLLQNILSALSLPDYSLLQVKEPSYQNSFISEALQMASFVLVFNSKEELFCQKKLFQTAYSLKELNEKNSQAQEKKKKLWEELQVWKKAQ